MHVDLTGDQHDLAVAAREILATLCPPNRVRAAWDSETGHDADLWARLAEVGFLGIAVPDRFGGLGLGDLEMALVLEEVGRVALPGPLLETAAAAVTLAEVGTPEQQERWLPAIVAGEVVATVAVPDQPLVVGANVADLIVLNVGEELHAVPTAGCEFIEQTGCDRSRRLATVRALSTGATRLAGDETAGARLRDRLAVGSAAVLVGIGAHLVQTTVDYVQQRRQFGRPVGSFQAVKHRLADAHLAVEFARPATWVAAHLLAIGAPEAPVAAAVAKAAAAEAEATANEHALQCHGGIGFTWEHDLHLWLKRGKALEQAYGPTRVHRAAIANALLGPPAAGISSGRRCPGTARPAEDGVDVR
ncbi:acyl-CoA/acyl-ACP dehydrogenase [Amycolatopsis acidiphila]|uniref:Acyl-CoA dehydrogenase n=1 Tax=Amycolatopsis acidiphila TaxID=715473 RepID=A0A558AI21_9PSEU|nr:acyl-CoA dehydrogenase family protein [Amycolatopsis acidiphila]TVT23907.1 acyl-CoA dehydrogenase [Amycolatopsis acidiphila]UIJ61116.1 acyl-CoA/acyl-ACP dehydrogenase [Amycolatopsis acidiphila]GHG86651.1 acyl-CoA dehydrogenase [Amycolatopsis acidiphila]